MIVKWMLMKLDDSMDCIRLAKDRGKLYADMNSEINCISV